MLKRTVALAGVSLLCAGMAQAQAKLALLIPDLYGPTGLKVDSLAVLPDGSTHTAHFNSSFQESFTPFNTAIATQLASVQIPSPASGFTYAFDSSLGVFKRSTESFGPILSDRAETIGHKKLSVGFHYQRFTFDSLDGVNLNNVDAVFTHDGAAPVPSGKADVVTTQNALDVTLNQFTAFVTYGLTDRLDVSLALPIVSVDLGVTSNATIQRIGTCPETCPASAQLIHFFRQADGSVGDTRTYTSSGSASGIGDILFRAKGTIYKQGGTGLALGLDARFPTGDEMNLLGSGAYSLKPFLIFSYSHTGLSPHLNVAYQWNGNSVLAGNVVTGEKADLPDIVFYNAGADLGLAKRLTVAFEFLGRTVINGEQLVPVTFHALNPQQTPFPNIQFAKTSFSQFDGAAGLKFNAGGNLLVDVNVTFKLNDAGLRDKVTPLVGFEYSF